MTWTIQVFDGRVHPPTHPYRTGQADTEREARRIAAQLLGHRNLRGASSWERYQGGTVFQFGPRAIEESESDFVVISGEPLEGN